jgi:acyl carrier protein
MQPVPIGTPGELYLGGQGQARGYLNKGEITAEKFVPNPFAKSPGQRLYRTGDEVRFKLDGTLEFLGRLDQQVKIRGYRIELGEVEFAIEQIKGVEKVVVIAKEDEQNHNYLIAYISGSIAREVILDKVKLRLPPYMIPTNIFCLDEFPLTPNGKIDREKLPNPVWVQEEKDTAVSGIQKDISEIWRKVLGIKSVGIYDGFLDVGGDSLLATQIFLEFRKAFKVDLRLTEILKVSTIAEQAKLIAEKQSKSELIKPAAIQVRKREARKIKL